MLSRRCRGEPIEGMEELTAIAQSTSEHDVKSRLHNLCHVVVTSRTTTLVVLRLQFPLGGRFRLVVDHL